MHNLGVCHNQHIINDATGAKAAELCGAILVLKFYWGRHLSCGTDGPYKVKGSLLWAAYLSLDS